MSVSSEIVEIDELLVSALRPGPTPWTVDTDPRTVEVALSAVDYHGVAGLLHERLNPRSAWPESARVAIRERAMAQVMWELRHKVTLSAVLEVLEKRAIPALLLKGTAIAYDLYEQPGERSRGDTDLLVQEKHLPQVRQALTLAGFRRVGEDGLPERLRAQESWLHVAGDGSRHVIDLHWRVLNAPALHETFPFELLWDGRRTLTKLSEAAFAPARPMLLAHACVHRAFHDCSPYFVGGESHFGGNRLVWLWDIALLVRSLSRQEWEELASFAAARGLGAVIADGVEAAGARFGSYCPREIDDRLSRAGTSNYLRSGQFGRAALDWWAVRGPKRKAQYAIARLLPSGSFMRAKYPAERDRPLPLLYLRRLSELVRPRPTGTHGR